MNRLAGILAILSLTALTSCGQQQTKEQATRYHESFKLIMSPYKIGTEKIMDDTKVILQKQISDKGFIRLTAEDSSDVTNYFIEFAKLTEATISKLEQMDTFEDFDLKQPSIEYVKKSSRVINGTYKELLFPNDSTSKNDLVKEFTADFLSANENYTRIQKEFLTKFGLN